MDFDTIETLVPFVLFLLLTLGLAAPVDGGVLNGVVQSGGRPIPGATVTATKDGEKRVTTTGANGEYSLDRIGDGRWTISVEMFGFTAQSREADAGGKADFQLELRTVTRRQRPAAAGRGQAAGFQSIDLTQTEQQIADAQNAPAAPPPPSDPANANEAFLVNGSLSQGLPEARQEDPFRLGGGAGFGEPGGIGERPPPGFGGAPNGEGSPSGRRPPPSGGGRGGPPGGFSGRGGGPPGGFSGRGGPGGAPGRAGRGGDRSTRRPAPRRSTVFGNRQRGSRDAIRASASYTFGNSAFDARPYSLTGQYLAKPSYASSRFNLSLGGALHIPRIIESDRTFFFINYTGNRSRNPYDNVATLAGAAERSGDFSQSAARLIHDPLNRLPFPGNRIPSSRIDTAAAGLLRFMPLPNQPGLVQNYQIVTSFASNRNELSVRINQALNSKNRIDGGFTVQTRDNDNVQLFGYRDSTDGLGNSANLTWTHNFSRQTIHNVRLNFNRNRGETIPYFAYKADVARQLGIAGVSNDPANFGPPTLNFTNFGDLSDANPLLRRDQTVSISEGWAIIRGRHTLGAGGEYRRMQLNNRTDQNGRGTFTFTGLATSAFNANNQPLPDTGFDFADFLLGLPQSSSIRFGGTNTYFRGYALSAYAQDDWRVRSNLTINAGLRYEYFSPFREKFGHIANLDVAPGFTGVAPVTPGQSGPYSGAFPDALVDDDPSNISPRVAVAWRPRPKHSTMIRSSYGVFFNGSVYNQFPSRLAAQPPFANTASLTTTTARPLTIQNGFAERAVQTIRNTFAVDRFYRVGYAQTWTASVQQGLTRQVILELGYIGTKGTRLDIQRQPNRAAPGSPLSAEQRRLIGNAVGFNFQSAEANSIYHAGQVRLTRRFSRGVSANALYTYSKAIDNSSSFGGGGNTVAQNDRDLRAERGLSSFDQRHTLSLFYVLTSPVDDRGRIRADGLAGRLLRDWTLSGGIVMGSGAPRTARVLGNQADAAGTGVIGAGRADASGLPVNSSTAYFNTAAFIIPPSGRYGNAGRNTIPGPGRVSFNASFGRSFRMSERRRIEFRIESQNLMNHANHTGIGTVINAIDYGLATGVGNMRTMSAMLRFRF